MDSTATRQVKAYSVTLGGNTSNYPDTVVYESSDPHGTRATVWDRDTNSYKTMTTTPGGTPIESINFQLLRDRFVNGIGAYIAYAQTASARYSSSYSSLSDPHNPGSGCQLDGQNVSCAKLIREVNRGWAEVDTHQPYRGIVTETRLGEGGPITQQIPEGIDGLFVGIDDSSGQQTTKPPCITPLWIANNPEWQPSYQDAWLQSAETGDNRIEHGGWMFYDRKENQTYLFMAGPGDKDSMPNEPEEFRALVTSFLKWGRDMIFIGTFHTHPTRDLIVGALTQET